MNEIFKAILPYIVNTVIIITLIIFGRIYINSNSSLEQTMRDQQTVIDNAIGVINTGEDFTGTVRDIFSAIDGLGDTMAEVNTSIQELTTNYNTLAGILEEGQSGSTELTESIQQSYGTVGDLRELSERSASLIEESTRLIESIQSEPILE